MKNYIISIFLYLLFFCVSIRAYSQTSLDFNQALLVHQLDTVPEGKTWKIVSYTTSFKNGENGLFPQIVCFINESRVVLEDYYIGHNTVYHYQNGPLTRVTKLPIWLPSGTILEPSTNCNFLSILEFNTINYE